MNINSLVVTGSRGINYTIAVDAATGRATCTCPAFYYGKGKACKHMEFAIQALAGSPAQRRLTLVK